MSSYTLYVLENKNHFMTKQIIYRKIREITLYNVKYFFKEQWISFIFYHSHFNDTSSIVIFISNSIIYYFGNISMLSYSEHWSGLIIFISASASAFEYYVSYELYMDWGI